MIHRALAVGGAVMLLLATAGTAIAEAPGGPRLAFVRFAFEPTRSELLTIGLLGQEPLKLAGTTRGKPFPAPLEGISWSADGSRLAFAGLGGRGQRIFTVAADGTGLKTVRGTTNGAQPVFSPDGHTIAFARFRIRDRGERVPYASVATWLVDSLGGAPRRLTPWRDGLSNVPSSFSPDGTLLALSRDDPRHPPQVVALRLSDGRSTVLARGATEPVYSPDGSEIALVRTTEAKAPKKGRFGLPGGDIHVLAADGSGSRQLTHTPSRLERWPSWDPSGERLVFTQFSPKFSFAAVLGLGDSVIAMNADGTCRGKLLFDRQTAHYAASWQPGPGREAGRIEC